MCLGVTPETVNFWLHFFGPGQLMILTLPDNDLCQSLVTVGSANFLLSVFYFLPLATFSVIVHWQTRIDQCWGNGKDGILWENITLHISQIRFPK